jgi:Cu(I)/Ag(I) efflux system membrane fusion protein
MNKAKVAVALALLAGAAVGYLFGRTTHPPATPSSGALNASAASQRSYTCSMHPQVRLDRPGKCPICEMPLIPASSAESSASGTPQLQLSDHALSMASVETALATRRELSRELRAVGKIEYNESSLATVTARVDGYAERVFVNFAGVEIKAGDHLAEVYSPDLIVAQQELLIALQSGADADNGPLVQTAKLKLQRWGLTAEQIAALVEAKQITDRVTLYSPIQGTVIEKSIFENSAFRVGDALYRVAKLDTVWVYLDIYEHEFAWVRYGQGVELVAEALPGRTFDGLVTFVQPIVNEESRTIRVPVHVENEDHALKPGMFVSAIVRASLASDGRAAPTGVEGKFSCPMHPQVLRDEAGRCPDCEMRLEKIPGQAPERQVPSPSTQDTPATAAYACPMKCEGPKTYTEPGNCPVCEMELERTAAAGSPAENGVLCVPVAAVLDSGTRKLVYVEQSRGLFEAREVLVGPRAGAYFAVLDGLVEGERVVTRGGFLIDSQFQITGHPSLFYPGGLMGSASGHSHPDSTSPANPPSEKLPADKPAAGAGQHKH